MNDLWLAAPAGFTLAMTLLNRLTWLRPAPAAAPLAGVSALVPARNEAANIGPCVRALLAAGVAEVVVYDDASTDGTAAEVVALGDDRVRLLIGAGPPAGWLGKPHACARLTEAARHEWLLFVDADVRVEPSLLAHLATAARGVDAVTVVPRQDTPTWAEALVVPLLHLIYTSWLPLDLVHRVRATSILAANGQLILVGKAAVSRAGGFAAVRDAIVDDMAFCRRLKRTGSRVRIVDGHDFVRCRMYQDAQQVVDGFSKNLYAGVGGNPFGLALALGLQLAAFLLPWLVWPTAPVAGGLGIAANLAQRALLARRHAQPWRTVVGHPVAIVLLVAIGLRSAWWAHTGRTRWRGRLVPT